MTHEEVAQRLQTWPADHPVRTSVERILHQGRLAEQSLMPDVAVILGSGLAGFERHLEGAIDLPYADIGLPTPHVEGHGGHLHIGRLRGRNVAVLSGRVHYYEGHDMETVIRASRVMAVLGARTLLVTNAAGGANPAYAPGDLMLIRDHINFMGMNPLRGPNVAALGTRFPDMSTAYDPALRDVFKAAASRLGQRLHEGVYLAVSGPSYETPAEIAAFARMGADAIGMSTVPEVIASNHAGMTVGALSCITNLAAGLARASLSHEEVKEVGAAAGSRVAALISEVIGSLT